MTQLITKDNIDIIKFFATIIINGIIFILTGNIGGDMSELKNKKQYKILKKYIVVCMLALDIILIMTLVGLYNKNNPIFFNVDTINYVCDKLSSFWNSIIVIFKLLFKDYLYSSIISYLCKTVILLTIIISYILVLVLIIAVIFYPFIVFCINEKKLRIKYEFKLKGYLYKDLNLSNKILYKLERAVFVSVIQNIVLIVNLVYNISYYNLTMEISFIYGLMILFNFLNFTMIKKLMFYVNEIKGNASYEFILVDGRKFYCSNYKEDSTYIYIYTGSITHKLNKSQIVNSTDKNIDELNYNACFVEILPKNLFRQLINKVRKTEIYQSLIF